MPAVGLGKSQTCSRRSPTPRSRARGRTVLYLTAVEFIARLRPALKNQTAMAFKEALRGITFLIIDDVQFLQGRTTQTEFCHTLTP